MTHELLDDLMSMAGEEPGSPYVDYLGQDPIFPTIFRIGDMGAATIGAAAVEAARIYEMRTGRMQHITIPVDSAAIAMRASCYIRPDPPPEQQRRLGGGGGGLGTYRTKDDRWIYFQRLFQHHQERLAAVLGCEYEEEAIVKAVATWNGEELEQAVVDGGATVGMVRTQAEWVAHPHAQALAKLPLFEVVKIGDSDPMPFGPGDRPLSGLKVLDVTRVLAGPTAGRTLAEHGAQVLRIGTPEYPDNDLMMRDTGHGKRSAVLNLRDASAADTLRGLIGSADVFSQGYRPGAIVALGFSPEEVAALRPGIVYMSLSAFGHEGPWAGRRGFDSVVQSCSGLADDSKDDEGRPRFLPANPLDYAPGYLAAFAIMVALRRRATEGGSYLVRASLAQTGRWLNGMGRADKTLVDAQPAEIPAERMEELMMVRDTPFGRLKYFGPCAEMSETPGRWDLPTVPLDYDQPEWV